jgi:hypothetical protein
MKILNPNIDEKIVCILKHNIYVRISDFGSMCFLKEVKIAPAQHSWEWIDLKATKELDLSEIDNKYCTFENAINRSVNDPYCTVYEFESFEEVFKTRKKIKYIDIIKTVYKNNPEQEVDSNW